MIGILLVVLIVVCVFMYMNRLEGFTPYGPYQIGENNYQNGLGSKFPGLSDTPGAEQIKDRSAHIDKIPSRNPQNVMARYKEQPRSAF